MPEPVGAAAYRIIQESLTNVLRHAGTTSVDITMAVSSGMLHLTVADAGRALGVPSQPPATSGGSGIAGIRAQAQALGGLLTAASGPGPGYTVDAVLPLGELA
ncbi:sensor histidine kinase [Actinoplanes sp. NPDC051343]|uniref:sensor histidine kinase n=1 Tax=Actinoplanes sp. NPDC051343 TaxID=3363906 RepID=UPI0037BC4554